MVVMGAGSTFQPVEILDVDGIDAAEEHDQYREPDRRLRGGNRQDEEDEYLPGSVAQEMRESDEIHVDGEQHELDRHQEDDHVLAVQEDPDDRNGEKNGREHEIVRERDHFASSRFSTGMDTMRTRSSRRTLIWLAGSMYLLSLRRRSASAIAAT